MSCYFNACGHGLPATRTLERMGAYIALQQQVGIVEAAARSLGDFDQVRRDAATLIGAQPENVGFSTTTTAAWQSIVMRLGLAGRRVLVAPHEWGANIRLLHFLAGHGSFAIETLPELDLREPDLTAWAGRIDDDVAAIFIPLITSIDGHRYPAAEIARLPRPKDCLVVVDGAQAIGQMPVDLASMSCDVFVATCRKWLRAPRGTALFWTAPHLPDHLAAPRMESPDFAHPLRLGLGAAIAEMMETGVAQIEAQVSALRQHAEACAARIGLSPDGGIAPQSGALCLGVPAEAVTRLQADLPAAGYSVKFPNRLVDEPHAPVSAPGMAPMRISPHIYNSTGQIDEFSAFLRARL